MREKHEKYLKIILASFVLVGLILSIWIWCSLFSFPSALFPVSAQLSQLPPTTAALNSISNPLQYTAIPAIVNMSTLTPQLESIIPALTGEHLAIPSIGVDAPIETLGVLPNGVLAPPEINPWTGVGWYAGGVAPGEQGSAVMDGFLNAPGGDPAVFWKLHNLRPGDSIQVITAGGSTLDFRVLGLGAYPLDAADVSRIFNNTSGHFLNLITYPDSEAIKHNQNALRLVVYTSLAP